MSIFGQKKLTLDDILKGISNLSDEDRAKLNEALAPAESPGENDENADPAPEPETKPDTAPTEDNAGRDGAEAEEGNEESSDATAGDSNDAQEGEDPAATTEPTAEPESTEPSQPVAPPDYEELFAGMKSRMEAMSELVSNLTERIDALTESVDKGSFGNHSPGMPSGDIDDDGDMSPTMRSYTKKQTYR